jgi:hypothetical protein
MTLTKVVWTILFLTLFFFLVHSPAQAGRLVQVAGEGAGEWLHSAAQFLARVTK